MLSVDLSPDDRASCASPAAHSVLHSLRQGDAIAMGVRRNGRCARCGSPIRGHDTGDGGGCQRSRESGVGSRDVEIEVGKSARRSHMRPLAFTPDVRHPTPDFRRRDCRRHCGLPAVRSADRYNLATSSCSGAGMNGRALARDHASDRSGVAALRSPPLLVGRAREQDILREELAAAFGGRGRLVLLGGEAGIGKTTLAQDLAGRRRPTAPAC